MTMEVPDLSPLYRYQDIVPHFDAFLESCEQPLPSTVRVNTLRADPAAVRESLEERGIAADPFSWYPAGLRIDADRPGTLFEHFIGHIHSQEEVSMVPPIVLAPRPGERVLDLCAAPGSKTTHLAQMMENTGHIIANDVAKGRLPMLRANCERLGVMNTGFSSIDGRRFPNASFDRVLLDPACSSEGMARKRPDVLWRYHRRFRQELQRSQSAMIDRACELVRPGGMLVYSTCTYAPEDNEVQVARALERGFELVDGSAPPGFICSPGLTEWEEHRFPDQMRRCLRVYPHLNDTGGFFVASLRKRRA